MRGANAVEAEQMEELTTAVELELGALKELDEETKEAKLTDTKEMIRYYREMTDAIEDRRTRIYDQSLQLLAISITGLVVLVSAKNICPIISFTLGGALLLQSCCSLCTLLTHTRQSRCPYPPFKELKQYGNKWKWFYYGNEEVLNISTKIYRKSLPPKDTLEPYLRGLRLFVHGYATEDTEKELIDNVQQLYLLQVHNYYKNRFYLQLIRIREWSVYLTIAGAVIGCVIGWLAL